MALDVTHTLRYYLAAWKLLLAAAMQADKSQA